MCVLLLRAGLSNTAYAPMANAHCSYSYSKYKHTKAPQFMPQFSHKLDLRTALVIITTANVTIFVVALVVTFWLILVVVFLIVVILLVV